MRMLSDLTGTLQSSFKIARATFLVAGLTANRSVTISDHDITLYNALATPTANRIPLRDADNYLALGRVVQGYVVNKINTSGAGGRFHLEVSDTSTLAPTSRRVSIDVSADMFRVYEGSDTTRGFYVDLAALATGAASNYTKQSGPSDSTADRLLAVGAGGILASTITVTNFDTLSVTGFFNGAAAVGAPPAAGAATVAVLHFNISSTTAVQIATRVTSSAGWRRFKTGGVWSSWVDDWNGATFDPTTKADLAGSTFTGVVTMPNGLKVRGTGTSGDGSIALVTFYDSDGVTRRGYVGDGSSGNDDIYLGADTGDIRLNTAGDVYIGGVAVDNTDSDWISCTLVGGWTNFTGRTAQYRRIGKRVYLRGAVQNTTFANNNTGFWNVPSGFRLVRVGWSHATSCGAFLASQPGAVLASVNTQLIAFDGATASGTVSVNLDGVSWECA